MDILPIPNNLLGKSFKVGVVDNDSVTSNIIYKDVSNAFVEMKELRFFNDNFKGTKSGLFIMLDFKNSIFDEEDFKVDNKIKYNDVVYTINMVELPSTFSGEKHHLEVTCF